MPIKSILVVCLWFLESLHKICFAQQPKLVLPLGHTGKVLTAEFSNDGNKIITFSEDGTVKIWDTNTGELLGDHAKLSGGAGMNIGRHNLNSATFDPGGKHILINSPALKRLVDIFTERDLWGSEAGIITNNFELNQFSPDGKRIILVDSNKIAVVFSTDTREPVLRLKEKNGRSPLMITEQGAESSPLTAYSPDGNKMVTVADNNSVKVWNAVNGVMIADLHKQPGGISKVLFTPDGKKILLFTADSTMIVNIDPYAITFLKKYKWDSDDQHEEVTKLSPDGRFLIQLPGYNQGGYKDDHYDSAAVWDLQTGNLLYGFKNLLEHDNSSFFSLDGKRIILLDKGNIVNLRDAFTGKILFKLTGHKGRINAVRFSPDSTKILTASNDKMVKIWDAETGIFIIDLKGHTAAVYDTHYSHDGKIIVTASGDNTAIVWSAVTATPITTLKGSTRTFNSSWFGTDEKTIFINSQNVTRQWDIIKGVLVSQKKEKINVDFVSGISPDGNYEVYFDPLLGVQLNNTKTGVEINLELKDAKDGEESFIVNSELQGYVDARFGPDSKKLLVTADYAIKLFDIKSKTLLYTFINLDSTDNILLTPDGYYRSTPNAAKRLHYVTKDLKVISFEQLDVKYNRPDKVLQALGNTDTAMIDAYRKAYEKRIRKLNIDTAALKDDYIVPEADFVNRNDIAFEQKNETLTLHIKGRDSIYKLDHYNIWVNEVPVYSQRGISTRKIKSKIIDTAITIELSEGKNRIETSVSNVNGTESYRMPLIVTYTPAVKQKEKTYFIGIGIDQFANPDYNLSYSSKDIRDLSAKLKQKYRNDISIDTLFNENVTVGNIKALKQKLLQTTVNDRVIISYSGHGLLSKSYDYYLSTYSVNFKTPEENGLPYEEFENLLDSIPARKKLILIDACHSGEVDKEEFQQVKINKAALDANHIVGKGAEISNTDDGGTKKLGLKNSFELMQNLFVNVGKSTGATIISAAAGTEFALENGNLKNGVFTYCLLEAIDKYPTMKISELKKRVGARVEELTSGMQKPTSRNEAIAVDWNVW